MELDPTVWGPHYWFVLFSIAVSYSNNPNDVIKKKYYDFFHNLPLFIPHIEIGDDFSKLLDKYPVTPYLDSRDSLMKWVNFIHNRVNIKLGKNELMFVSSYGSTKVSTSPNSLITNVDNVNTTKSVQNYRLK